MFFIAIATEDKLSEAVLRKILADLSDSFEVIIALQKGGFGYLKSNMTNFNEMARQYPVVVLTDLDNTVCPIELLTKWLNFTKEPNLIFRVAVKEVESWLLADATALSIFLGVDKALFPRSSDDLADPKQELLNIVKRSKNRRIKRNILPEESSTSPVGLGYNAIMTSFVKDSWDAERASNNSNSLKRTLNAIRNLLAE